MAEIDDRLAIEARLKTNAEQARKLARVGQALRETKAQAEPTDRPSQVALEGRGGSSVR